MSSVSQPGRIYRLCQKELRESLRDRRTIITLVLMPLLVYPLLSMILQRLLLTASTTADTQVIRIGLEDATLREPLVAAIEYGKHLLANRSSETLSVLSPDAPETSLSGTKSNAHWAVQHILGQDIQLFLIERDARQNLISGAIDILVRGQARAAQLGEIVPPGEADDPSAAPGQQRRRRSEMLREILANMPEDRYSIDYIPGDRHSEWALQFMRSIFAAVNDESSTQLLRFVGAENHPRISMSAAPIKMPSSTPSTLASLVPLVLVLMTIAGAVYPAIDLTAGERERGTLEAMIVSPTPRSLLLLAKYVAVVTVALLTAIANLLAMSITLWASGLGRLVFGAAGLSIITVLQILCLLVLFAMFFSAVLLSITSFAKSFKEAQAYLIPVMLVSLAPGVLSLLPQVYLTNMLAAVPLANIVLLSRDVLIGSASSEAAVISIVCTLVYAVAAIAVASRLFGSDASLQGSQGSWKDLLRRPDHATGLPTVDQMALTMACMFPIYFVASTSLPRIGGEMPYPLIVSAFISWALIFGLPTLVSMYRRHDMRSTYLLTPGRVTTFLVGIPAMVLLGVSLWMISHELMMFSEQLGLATLTKEQLERAAEFASRMPKIPLAILLATGAITPALCEEWFFRGFVMSSLRKFGPWTAIVGSASLFAMMHVLTSNMLSLERLLPSLFMGLVLGLIAWRTGTIWPGMLLHAIHNGLLLSIGHFKSELEAWGIGLEEGTHLPALWLLSGCAAIAVGFGLLSLLRRPADSTPAI